MKLLVNLTLCVALSVGMFGCGGGGGSDDQGSDVSTGRFLDSAVSGIRYETSSRTGYTEADGQYEYRPGEIVTFYVGDIKLGSSLAKGILTPIDLGSWGHSGNINNGSTMDDTICNMTRFLQALDQDGDPSNGIEINREVDMAAKGVSLDFNLSIGDFEADEKLTNFLSANGFNGTLPNQDAAMDHLYATIASLSTTTNTTSLKDQIKGAGHIGTYGDFDVYELLNGLPDGSTNLTDYTDVLVAGMSDIFSSIVTPTVGFHGIAIKTLQAFGLIASIEVSWFDSSGEPLGKNQLSENSTAYSYILIQTPTRENWSGEMPPFKMDIYGATHTAFGYIENFLPADAPYVDGVVTLESSSLSDLQPGRVYMIVPQSGLIDDLYPSSGNTIGPSPTIQGEGLNIYDSTKEGFTFADPGAYQMVTNVEQLFSGSRIGGDRVANIDIHPTPTPAGSIGTVTSLTGRVWMDKNLGASRVATAYDDSAAYGDFYQWGRGPDGHEKRDSLTSSTLSSSDTPGHGSFIIVPSPYPYDWRNPQNDSLWQGVSGLNNPCPSGFRLPTISEWEAERATWSTNNRDGAFASPLKLASTGTRSRYDGSIDFLGSGKYWSSSVNGINARFLHFDSTSANPYSHYHAEGFSVRCIED